MASGNMECSHAFYLKFYHIMLANGSIVHEPFDLLMLDEAGDLNPVTLEIFHLLPATTKIMVGDECQNIYVFNQTINGFESVKDKALNMSMTKSCRVSSKIAPYVESFGQHYINPDMQFQGIDYTPQELSDIRHDVRFGGRLCGKCSR